ncbi:MAG: NAD(P)H-dependent oxidoreductase [Tissierellia bacterium]|nr:NAD(P)H-dependent oxidoreductase [Tissierellia bacterium]
MKIGLIVGSLRKASWNRKVAEVAKEFFPEGVEAEFIDISNLPFYNQDLDGKEEEYTKVRKEIEEKDGFIFFAPEYNRSFAPALKNVIDVGSIAPQGNVWAKKPAAVFSASMGSMGGMGGNHALRNTFIYVNLIPMQQPEVYLGSVQNLFKDGEMVEGTKEFIKTSVEAFIDHAKMVNAAR